MGSAASWIGDQPVTLDMLRQMAYCPRRFHLMYADGRWSDNVYTLDGKAVHRRVDRIEGILPDPDPDDSSKHEGDEPPSISRSVKLGSQRLGITAKLDLVSTAGKQAVPVDTKRGRVPNNPERSWEPERVQLMAQGLLLREHGYETDHGVLYFAGSRTRVDVPFSQGLEARTLELIDEIRKASTSRSLPDPLDDSPKCHGCSLSGICLPDETLALKAVPPEASDASEFPPVRRLYPPRERALPLYVQEQGSRVGKSGKVLVVKRSGEELGRARLKDVSQLVLLGNVMISAQAVHLLCEAAIPVIHLSMGHWFYGITHGITLRNAFDRQAQFSVAADPVRCLAFAQSVVDAKGANQRTLIGRNVRPRPRKVTEAMSALLKKVSSTPTLDELRGLEGGIAAHYFSNFHRALRPRDFESEWDFEGRNRRPPRDPINALLSFGYALLAKECSVVLLAEGLDPWWGLFHQPRHGRPALALDLMEEFRPLVVDSAVLTAVNTGMVTRANFSRSGAACSLGPKGRKGFLRAYEARMDQLITHPVFGYRCSWRSIIRVQARLLARWLRGDVPRYIPMKTR